MGILLVDIKRGTGTRGRWRSSWGWGSRSGSGLSSVGRVGGASEEMEDVATQEGDLPGYEDQDEGEDEQH